MYFKTETDVAQNLIKNFFMAVAVATYFYYEKVRRMICTAIVSYLLKSTYAKEIPHIKKLINFCFKNLFVILFAMFRFTRYFMFNVTVI